MKIRAPKMTGIEALTANFDALGSAMITSIASDAITVSAELLAEEWRRIAPYRTTSSTAKKSKLSSGESVERDYGHLRANIWVRRLKPRRFTEVATIVSTGHAFWATFYEYGTAHQKARPTFRPALRRLRGELVEVQAEVVKESIEQVLANGGATRRFGPVLANGRNG